MSNIAVLPSHLADLIAAGEVVERPASVAKELMENAIDAGATKITVEIERGGMTYLRVTDNGAGIPANELSTAFLRHATSKLRTERDLEAIGTLGFRGEALAAISAVSRIEVMTRRADCEMGASLHLEAGVPEAVEEAGCPFGTTMVVRDLFHNTPARLKFVKKDASEGAAVFAAVQRTALSHPEVAVTFIRDGKQELQTAGDGQLKSALYAVLGRNIALGYIAVNSSDEHLSLSGYVSLPTCCRGSRSYQHFFVNGRYVKSGALMKAVEEAYRNQKMVGRFPGCTIHLNVSPASVDVNVHPAKTEIKFHNEREIFHFVYHAVSDALTGGNVRPSVPVEAPVRHQVMAQETAAVQKELPKEIKKTIVQKADVPVRPVEHPAPKPVVAPTRPAVMGELHLHDFYQKEVGQKVAPVRKIWDSPAVPAPEPKKMVEVPPVAPPEAEKPVVTAPMPKVEPIVEEIAIPETPWRVAGEVLHTYIIVEQGETVLLIDKHAAHERMNFDRMKAEGYQPMMQSLLVPLSLKLPAEEQMALLEHTDLLEQFGFDVEDFGGSIVVRQLPFDVDVDSAENVLLELATTLMTTGRVDPASARDEILHTMACKAAIKGGWNTSEQELQRVAELVMSGAVQYCPHGRPVAIEMTKYQIEKMFKRA